MRPEFGSGASAPAARYPRGLACGWASQSWRSSPVDAAPHAVVADMGTVAPSVVTDVWAMAPSAPPVGASPAAIGTMAVMAVAVAVAHDAGDVDRRRRRGVTDHAPGGDDDGLAAAIVA